VGGVQGPAEVGGEVQVTGRGIHPSTSQLTVSIYCGKCLALVHFSVDRKHFSWDALRGFSDQNGSG
jgi:hypothetical protein